MTIRSYKGITPSIPDSCYVDQSAQVIGDVAMGKHASIWMNAVVRGDVHSIRIGAYSNIQDCSVLHGMKDKYGVFLGEYVTVGHSVTLHGCTIEDRCLIGMGSIILNGARIGADCIIAGRHCNTRRKRWLRPDRYGWDVRESFAENWTRKIAKPSCGMPTIIWDTKTRTCWNTSRRRSSIVY